jgi:(p)ppGpp synthase/HD superfamily hydrolase
MQTGRSLRAWGAAMSRLIDAALIFATEKHAGQVRKYTGTPYIFHPISVAMIVMETPDHTEDMVAAALLHDVAEDCGVPIEEIGARFGAAVRDLVYWLTDSAMPEDGNRAEREAIERAKWARCDNAGAKTVKLADLLDNTSSILARDPGFAETYLQEKRLMLPLLEGGDPELQRRVRETISFR